MAKIDELLRDAIINGDSGANTCTTAQEDDTGLTLASLQETIRQLEPARTALQNDAQKLVKKMFDIDVDGALALRFVQEWLGGHDRWPVK